ncbi:MAG: hypothetical protein M3N26_09660, partial [Pseudomonadota bacterium]|nr:hypothetical protein [Pseudomonadota bacterium]
MRSVPNHHAAQYQARDGMFVPVSDGRILIQTLSLGRLTRYGGAMMLAWSVGACAVGPNFVPPEDPPVSRYTK